MSDTNECGRCGNGTSVPGHVTVPLSRGEATIIFRNVPAMVCDVCGDEILTAEIGRELERIAEAAIAAGVQYEVRQYKSAAA